MKRPLLFLVLCTCMISPAFGQSIENAGFEAWTNGNPVDWWTNNLQGLLTPIVQTSNAHEGASALIGTVLEFSGNAFTPILGAGVNGVGFPINSRPEALHGWYTFHSDSGDNMSITIAMTRDGQPIGAGIFYSPVNHSVYTEFAVNITYNFPDIPDTVQILFLISNAPEVHVGSTFTLDDLSFGKTTPVDEDPVLAREFTLEQNYPNPFNPSTLIPFEIGYGGFVTLKVYDLLGQEVATLINEHMLPGRYRAEFDASGVPAGMYVYRLQVGDRVESRKMVVLK